jgi:predicted RNA-binding protein with PIN domain
VSFTRHLLVDGANIVQAWPALRAMGTRGRDAARAQLVQHVSAIHDGEAVRVTVVFDGRGDELVVVRPSAQVTLSVLHTPATLTADDVIEQLVAQSRDPASCIVATDDRAEQDTVTAAGAQTLSSRELASWVGRAEARLGGKVETLRRTNAAKWKKRS